MAYSELPSRPFLGIPSPTHSFFPVLKPFFSTNLSHCIALPFFLLKYLLHGFPGLFTVLSGHICFLLLVFFVFTLFSCRFRAVDSFIRLILLQQSAVTSSSNSQ